MTDGPDEGLPRRALAFLAEHWWPICIFVGALLVRIHWNLVAHPIGEFLYSDMRGYNGRADAIIEKPWGKQEYKAFFPYGTTFIVAAVKYTFGKDNFAALGIVWALMGSCVALFTYYSAKRLEGPRWIPPAIGVLLVFYYPLVSIGGYVLSETPASFFLAGSILFLLRLIDEGRWRDAILLGVFAGAGITVRPQIMVSVAFVFFYWLIVRKHVPKLTLPKLLVAVLPVLLFVGFSAGRLHYHTGRLGLVSENGPINAVFGRCHNKGIFSLPDGKHGTVRFAPPPLIQLEKHSKKHPDHFVQLDPTYGRDASPVEGVPGFKADGIACKRRKGRDCIIPGSEIQYKGYIGDKVLQNRIAAECVRRNGVAKQAKFVLVHWIQLFAFNQMWPEQADPKPRAVDKDWRWSVMTKRWRNIVDALFMVPSLLGLLFVGFPKTRVKTGFVALNLWALLLVAALYVGGIRFRVPYDPVILLLAFSVYGLPFTEWFRKLRVRFGGQPAAPAPKTPHSTAKIKSP